MLMQKCLVLCKTLDVFVVFYGQENGHMGKIVDKISAKDCLYFCADIAIAK